MDDQEEIDPAVRCPKREPAGVAISPVVVRGQVTAAGIEASGHVTEGAPAIVIAQAARAIPADLIVMGTRGLTGLKHIALGSVAERSVRLAPCPVLTVKAHDD